jgi:hypothetical protein
MKNLQTLKIEPYLTTLDLPFGDGDISRPGARVVVVADLNTTTFERHGHLSGYFKFKYNKELPGGIGKEEKSYDARLWWEDGMQSLVAHDVHILTDDIEAGIYVGFCMQNSKEHFMLLGKLRDGDELTELFRKEFTRFGVSLGRVKPSPESQHA